MSSVNILITDAGAQPTSPSTLRENIVNAVTAQSPGFTANLPGSLIEDITSTETGALVLIDQAAVDLVNSMTPSTSNPYILYLQGAQSGIARGALSNSSAYVLFTGVAGYAVGKGFVVSDGLNQYTVQDGGVLGNAAPTSFTASIGGAGGNTMDVTAITAGEILIGDTIVVPSGTNCIVTAYVSGTGGTGTYTTSVVQTVGSEVMTGTTHGTATLYVVANNYGTWAIPANTITTLITSVPTGYPLFCTNPATGIIATSAESEELYRARVLNSQIAPAVGTIAYAKSLVQNVPGVQSRLVSFGGGGKIMVGGGDPYLVAGAIFRGLFDISDLVGSSALSNSWVGTGSISGTTLTVATLSSGTVEVGDILSGVGLASPTIVLAQLTGSAGGVGDYMVNYSQTVLIEAISGSNSLRNQVVNIIDYPDVYAILFVVPVSQTVTMAVDWSTISPNFTANDAINSAVTTALAEYINSIPVGAQISVYSMQQIFLESVASVITPSLISSLVFTVSIDGVVTAPTSGTGMIPGDSEGFFITDTGKIVLTRV